MGKINLAGVKTRPEPLTPGYHPAVVAAIEEKQKQGKPYPFLAWTFSVTEGPCAGRKAFFNTSLSPQALFNLKRTLLALGFEEAALEGELETEDIIAQAVGAECTLVVIEGIYDGNTTGNVDRILEAGAAEEDAISEAPAS